MKKINVTETTFFGMLVTLAGGYMDSYSYLTRGKVFATGQTGNFVLLAIHLCKFQLMNALRYLCPIFCFFAGVFLSKHLFHFYFNERELHLKRSILYIEVILFFVIGFIPQSTSDVLTNSTISFCASLQFCGFRKLTKNSGYASVFCTGNMRSCAESLYLGLILKDKNELAKGVRYLAILSAFFIGVFIGVVVEMFAGIRAAWGISFILIISSLFIKKEMNRRYFIH